MVSILIFLIRAYQRALSPDHSWRKANYPYGYCRFYPTCSDYAAQAIQNYGSIHGLWFAVLRLTKCHPWATPRLDRVPPKRTIVSAASERGRLRVALPLEGAMRAPVK